MLTPAENELITRTGAGTPGGAFLRRFWYPVLTPDELAPGGAPSACVCWARTSWRFAAATVASGCWTKPVRTGAPASCSRATRTAGCAASSTAGRSTSPAPSSTCRPSPTVCLRRQGPDAQLPRAGGRGRRSGPTSAPASRGSSRPTRSPRCRRRRSASPRARPLQLGADRRGVPRLVAHLAPARFDLGYRRTARSRWPTARRRSTSRRRRRASTPRRSATSAAAGATRA